MPGLDGWDAPRVSPSETVRVGALFGAVVLCYEVELHAAVLFHASAYGPLHYGRGQATPQGEGIATQVLCQGKAEQHHDDDER